MGEMDIKGPYKANWESLNSHPLPRWFDDAKFGMFITWGVYSVPAWAPKAHPIEFDVRGFDVKEHPYSEWYWHTMYYRDSSTYKYHCEHYGETFKYDDFIPMFKAENYNPEKWAELAKKAGMRYVVIVTKHHDGFCLWPTKYTNRNSVKMGPKKDLLGPLVKAFRREGLKIGLYYSLYEWYNPLLKGKHTRWIVSVKSIDEYTGLIPVKNYVEDFMIPQIKELIDNYDPDILWFDGGWDQSADFWHTAKIIAYYYNQAEGRKEVCVNDRVGAEAMDNFLGGYSKFAPKYGDFFCPEYFKMREADPRKWETCRGIGTSFGFNRNEGEKDHMSVNDIVAMLVDIVAKNGNFLLNVGPTSTGDIPEIQKERLSEIGKWLKVNGEAIYGTRPWKIAQENDIRFTQKGDYVYAILLNWPGDNILNIKSLHARKNSKIKLLGYREDLIWEQSEKGLIIKLPKYSERPCDYAYSFKIEL